MLLFVCLLGHCCLFVGPSGVVIPRSERTGSGGERRRRGEEGEAWVVDISRHGYRRHRCGACYSLSTFTHVDNVYSVISSFYSRAVESVVCLCTPESITRLVVLCFEHKEPPIIIVFYYLSPSLYTSSLLASLSRPPCLPGNSERPVKTSLPFVPRMHRKQK